MLEGNQLTFLMTLLATLLMTLLATLLMTLLATFLMTLLAIRKSLFVIDILGDIMNVRR
jgi:hypothetical protein